MNRPHLMLVPLLIAAAVPCPGVEAAGDPETATVAGKVSLNGKPVGTQTGGLVRPHLLTRSFRLLISVLFWTTLISTHLQAQGDPEYSWSSDQAKQRKTLITKVRMVPNTIKWRTCEITTDDAWLEKSKDGGCYLCFRIAKGKEVFLPAKEAPFFVLEDARAGVGEHLGIGLKWIQAVQYLDSADLAKVRLSLINDWKAERLKNIRFIPIP
jgi:hypothetical protein